MTSGCTDLHLIFNEKLFYDVIETIFIFEVEVMLAVWEDDKAEKVNLKSYIFLQNDWEIRADYYSIDSPQRVLSRFYFFWFMTDSDSWQLIYLVLTPCKKGIL